MGTYDRVSGGVCFWNRTVWDLDFVSPNSRNSMKRKNNNNNLHRMQKLQYAGTRVSMRYRFVCKILCFLVYLLSA